MMDHSLVQITLAETLVQSQYIAVGSVDAPHMHPAFEGVTHFPTAEDP
jgi:hypothetical protein